MTASDAWPDLAGRLTDAGHEVAVRVYYEDTDFSGFVYHANYLRFMERGRSDFLRLMGIGHEALSRGELADRPLTFAVRRLSVEYVKPARIDDALVVETAVKEVGGATIVLAQAVRRADLTLVTAEVLIVVVDAGGKAQRLPPAMRTRLRERMPAAPRSVGP
jgi:acyl-CoA thioester hydrolase